MSMPIGRGGGEILISVVTPSLNQARFLRQNLDSVLQQGIDGVEHIIVDGGSSDGSREILDEYARQHPGRVRYISEPDRGQCAALNRGIAMTRGRFLGWQNVDDYYLPEAFRTALDYLGSHHGVAGVYGDCLKMSGNDELIGRWAAGPFDFGRLLLQDYIPNQSAFIRRDVMTELMIDESVEFAMDYDLWLRLGSRQPLGYVPVALSVNRVLPEAKSQLGLYPLLLDRVRVVERTLADCRVAERYRDGRKALLRHILKALLVAGLLGRGRDIGTLARKACLLGCGFDEWVWAFRCIASRSPWPGDRPGDVGFAQRMSRMLETAGLLEPASLNQTRGLPAITGRAVRTAAWYLLRTRQERRARAE